MEQNTDQNKTTPSDQIYQKKNSSAPIILVIVVVAVIAILYIFMSGSGNNLMGTNNAVNGISQVPEPSSVPADNTVSPTPNVSPSPTVTPTGNTSQITVTGTDFAFNPSTINVNLGDTVVITFVNAGTFAHNLKIPDLNVASQTIQPGEQTKMTFMPDQIGSFTFMCTIPGHADRGMVGTIVVS